MTKEKKKIANSCHILKQDKKGTCNIFSKVTAKLLKTSFDSTLEQNKKYIPVTVHWIKGTVLWRTSVQISPDSLSFSLDPLWVASFKMSRPEGGKTKTKAQIEELNLLTLLFALYSKVAHSSASQSITWGHFSSCSRNALFISHGLTSWETSKCSRSAVKITNYLNWLMINVWVFFVFICTYIFFLIGQMRLHVDLSVEKYLYGNRTFTKLSK